jgi:hypothetical protein
MKVNISGLLACAVAMSTVACNQRASPLPKPTLNLSQNKSDDQTLDLVFTNLSDEMLCASAADIDTGWGSVLLKQAGRDIFPTTQSNRAIKVVNDLDVLAPIYILMPGKSKFYYDIADYDAAKGEFAASLNVKVFACKDYFEGGFVRWLPVVATMKGTITEFRSGNATAN